MRRGGNARERTGTIQVLLAFALAGSSVPVGKMLIVGRPLFATTFFSLVAALAALLPALFIKRRELKEITRGEFLLIALQAAFGMALFRLFLLRGLESTSALHAGILTSLGPLVIGLASIAFYRERPSAFLKAGTLLAVGGVVMMKALPALAGGDGASSIQGDCLVFAAVLCETAMTLLRKKSKAGIGSLVNSALIVICAAAFTAPLALAEGGASYAARPLGFAEIAGLAYYGLVATALAYVLWGAGCVKVPGTRVGLAMAAMPISSLVLSCVLAGEPLGPGTAAGACLAVAGMLVGTRSGFSRSTRTRNGSPSKGPDLLLPPERRS
jgi:drug/metabolite transporter (DMT)-like permease